LPVDTIRGKQPVRVIPSLNVAYVMERLGWDHIDFLKIDVGTAEKYIFSNTSMAGEWLSKVSCLSIELHERYEAGCCEKPVHDAMQGHRFEWQLKADDLDVFCRVGWL
jgi:hypothetical protein